MFLVEILLPLYENDGSAIAETEFQRVGDELTASFGGMTAFTRAPAEGRWSGGERETHDEIVIFEVMVSTIDRRWWSRYRERLEKRFRQKEIIVRAHPIERL